MDTRHIFSHATLVFNNYSAIANINWTFTMWQWYAKGSIRVVFILPLQ